MTPQQALKLIHDTLRQVQTTADNHDLLREAVQVLAQVANDLSKDGAKPTEDIPAEIPNEA